MANLFLPTNNLKTKKARCFGKFCMTRNDALMMLRNPSALSRKGSIAKNLLALQSRLHSHLHLAILIFCLLWIPSSPTYALERVSLKQYPTLSLQVPNPMDTSKLPARKTYQVNHEEFVLQFFFNERDVFGYILKRNKSRPIHFRWCFFKSCEESAYNYNKIIAQAFNPPYDSGFFSIKFPSYLNYSFQGIEFSSPK